MKENVKVGIISCSGEEIPEGTVARQAVRRVLELMRPGETVTICLPLFLAGNEAERDFAKNNPTITVDGCEKLCAKRSTEKLSGPVSASLNVKEIIDGMTSCNSRSTRSLTENDRESIWLVSERLAAEVDSVLKSTSNLSDNEIQSAAVCACSKPMKGIELKIKDKKINIAGLPLIFNQLIEEGLLPNESNADKLIKTVKIYHHIEKDEEDYYREALLAAYHNVFNERNGG